MEAYIDDIKNNRPIFATKYENLWADAFQKIEEQGKIGTFDADNSYSKDLWRIFENADLANKNLSDEKVLQQLDKNIVALLNKIEGVTEQRNIVYYASLLKSLLLYCIYNSEQVEQISELVKADRSSKNGNEIYRILPASCLALANVSNAEWNILPRAFLREL